MYSVVGKCGTGKLSSALFVFSFRERRAEEEITTSSILLGRAMFFFSLHSSSSGRHAWKGGTFLIASPKFG